MSSSLKRISTTCAPQKMKPHSMGLRTIERCQPPNKEYTLEIVGANFKGIQSRSGGRIRHRSPQTARDTTIRFPSTSSHSSVVGPINGWFAIYRRCR